MGRPGPRIAIIGPSNSGKSTLAAALASRLGLPCYHLDQIAHESGTAWQRVPDSHLCAAHDRIVAQERWVIDGNYSVCMRSRFLRASCVIWLDPPLPGCLFRYVRRCLRSDRNRPGGLSDARREFNFHLVRYTLVQYPRNRIRYHALLREIAPPCFLSFRRLVSAGEVIAACAAQVEDGSGIDIGGF